MGVVEVVAMGPMEGTVAMTTEDMEVTGATMEEEEEEEVVAMEEEVSAIIHSLGCIALLPLGLSHMYDH